ncbi:ligand-binding sensor domain-containing protein [Spirosoma humi]
MSKRIHVYALLLLFVMGTACNGPAKKEKGIDHPKLIKTIGSPKYGNVQCGLQDKAGNLWFGTTENGLYKYDGKTFTQFLVTNGLNSNDIYCLLEDKDGKIWVGTKVGLCRYDGKTFSTIQIPLRKNQPPNKNHLYGNLHWVFSIMQAKSGKLWFATIDGVYSYDGKSFTPFTVNEGAGGLASSNNNVEHILEDKAGNIWFGGRGNEGVYRYDGTSVINIKPQELSYPRDRDSIRIGQNWAWPQLQDKNGNIWFSNWGGAYRYDGKSFTSFTASDGLTIGAITRIIDDRNGNLWFGGAGGLSRYDGKSFTCFNDGLINPWIWEVLDDKTGKLWVGTRATGLYLFDEKTFINYSDYKGREGQK